MPARTRFLAFLVAAALAVLVVHREAARGTFDHIEATYRDWLTGITVGPPADPAVTFVRIVPPDESERAPVLDGWPPVALDFAVLLDNLADYAPPVTGLHAVPTWDPDDPVSGPALVDQARRLPQFVLGCLLENQAAATRPDGAPTADESAAAPLAVHPSQVEGDPAQVPVFSKVLLVPPDALRDLPHARLGFTAIDLGTPPPPGRHPLLARSADGSTFTASFVLQALAAATETPLADVRIALGRSARIGPLELPVDAGAGIPVPSWIRPRLHRVEADSLFLDSESAALAEPAEIESLERLRSDLVVLGGDPQAARTIALEDGARVGPAEFAALALTAARSGHLFREMPPAGQWTLWGALALAGSLLMLGDRSRATSGALLLAFAYVLAVFLVFDSLRIRWPVAVPATLIVLAVALARVLPPPPAPRPDPLTDPDLRGPGSADS